MRNQLIRNAARCKHCNTVIESKRVHDFVKCPCGKIFVDGGLDYCHRGGAPEDSEDLSVWVKDKTKKE